MRPLALLLVASLLAGCAAGIPGLTDKGGLHATIRWTSYGIPHITAGDWKGIGYGYGYAAATDYLCKIAEEYVTVNGERSRYFGAEGTYALSSNGQTYQNAQSDLFFTLLKERPQMARSMADFPDPKLHDLLDGYVAGYDRYLHDTPDAQRPAECAGKPWVRDITREDVVHRANKVNLIASSVYFAPAIVRATPPGSGVAPIATPILPLPTPEALGIGSNGYAFGSQMTANGRGMLLGNPHFPWQGPERFHELHLTIPGEIDVMGATLLGVPLVLIGFTDSFAWTHTVSTGWRFSIQELQLVPGDPTSYVVDGATEKMTSQDVTIDAGNGTTVTHTFYFSRNGPIFDLPVASGPAGIGVGLSWTPEHAYAVTDAVAGDDRTAEQFIRFAEAKDFDAFLKALHEVHGIPWVNTIAASKDGRAYYGDISVVPGFDAARIQQCNTPLGVALYKQVRLPIFDGSRSACAPLNDSASEQPGILPASAMPEITTRDWLINSNDDYWLPNPAHPLTGFSPMIGAGPGERSGRTREGYVEIGEVQPGTLTLDGLQKLLFADRTYFGERALAEVVAGVCTPAIALASDHHPVDLTAACATLAKWDGRAHVDSAGLPLFELFWSRTPIAWSTPFDPADPVNTPRGFIATDPRVRVAMADAVELLASAGLKPDVTAGDARFVLRDGAKIPLHGASHAVGSPNVLIIPFEAGKGFGEPLHGSSYIQTVTWGDDGAVRAQGILTYSQSTADASPHRADQTRLFSQGTWIDLPFTDASIRADPALKTFELRGP